MCIYANKEDLIMYLDQQIRVAKGDGKKALQDVIKKVIAMPAADVRTNTRGHWQKAEVRSMFDGKGVSFWYCSNCRTIGEPHKRFCCECGAIMDYIGD